MANRNSFAMVGTGQEGTDDASMAQRATNPNAYSSLNRDTSQQVMSSAPGTGFGAGFSHMRAEGSAFNPFTGLQWGQATNGVLHQNPFMALSNNNGVINYGKHLGAPAYTPAENQIMSGQFEHRGVSDVRSGTLPNFSDAFHRTLNPVAPTTPVVAPTPPPAPPSSVAPPFGSDNAHSVTGALPPIDFGAGNAHTITGPLPTTNTGAVVSHGPVVAPVVPSYVAPGLNNAHGAGSPPPLPVVAPGLNNAHGAIAPPKPAVPALTPALKAQLAKAQIAPVIHAAVAKATPKSAAKVAAKGPK